MAKVEFSVQSVIEDEEVEQVKVTVTVKEGVTNPSSFIVERAVLKFAASHIPSWAKYCIDNEKKTLD